MAAETLVGRDKELAEVRAACARAREGHGEVVVLSGEAGLGKSALSEAAAAEAAAAGFTVARGRGWELAEAPAYFPLRVGFRALGVEAAAPSDADGFRLWEEVLAALARAASVRPFLWVLEDLHVADVQTLDLLCFLTQQVRALAVVLLITVRTRDDRLNDRARARLARLRRDAREIALAPMNAREVGALATRWAGVALPARAADDLTARTGGNPLFVIECARAWRSAAPGVSRALPASVAAMVAERLALLPERSRHLLADAAVLGGEVEASVLGRMNDALPARIIDDLAPAVRAGFLDEGEPGRYRFAHALVREAVDVAGSAGARAEAHARAEAALAALGEAPHLVVERAHHALAGLAAGRGADAVALTERALGCWRGRGRSIARTRWDVSSWRLGRPARCRRHARPIWCASPGSRAGQAASAPAAGSVSTRWRWRAPKATRRRSRAPRWRWALSCGPASSIRCWCSTSKRRGRACRPGRRPSAAWCRRGWRRQCSRHRIRGCRRRWPCRRSPRRGRWATRRCCARRCTWRPRRWKTSRRPSWCASCRSSCWSWRPRAATSMRRCARGPGW